LRETPDKVAPEISVILPVRNEAEYIERILQDLLDQDLPEESYEIIVVDGRSDDDTRARVSRLAATHGTIRLLDNPRRLAGAARNIGAAAARAPYILFVDGHCRILSPRMLPAVLAAFRDGADCVSRPQPLWGERLSPFQQAVALARGCWLGHDANSHIYRCGSTHCSPLSAGCGYRRDLYLELGGVDESFDACEDLEFNDRVSRSGVQAVHHPDFAVAYVPRSSWLALLRQLYRYGFGRARMWRLRPSWRLGLAPLLSVFTLTAALLPLLGLLWPPAWRVWCLLAGGYLLTGTVTSLLAARRAGKPALWWRILGCLVAIHLGAGSGFLAGLLGGPSWSHRRDHGHGR